MSLNNLNVTIYPADCEFEIAAGSIKLTSKNYANSSNAYRGARSAIRNLLKNKFVTNESNWGSDVVAITNSNGYVMATSSYSKPALATKAVNKVLDLTSGIKPSKVLLEVERD